MSGALPSPGPDPVVAALRTALGDAAVITPDRADAIAPYLRDWRGQYQSRARAVIRPARTAAVSRALTLTHRHRVPVIPLGGNTGHVGGGVGSGAEVILSTERLTAIRALDADNDTATVEAGVILSDLQTAALGADRFFPLSLGAEGSCRIGGNIATNAGGVAVLKYGTTRDLVLGLEVVLADGQVWDGLNALRKNNTGYDLKQLFIGAEGTLGVITAAVVKLFPKPRQVATALVGLADPRQALGLLHRARARTGDRITAFELMPRVLTDLAVARVPGTAPPPEDGAGCPWYALIEATSPAPGEDLAPSLETALAEALEDGTLQTATPAPSLSARAAFWRLREAIVEAQRAIGPGVKHDISVPVARMPGFITETTNALAQIAPDATVFAFGHLGDGNIHFNLGAADPDARRRVIANQDRLTRFVHDRVVAAGGAISAEHGIGLMKCRELAERKAPVELAMMRAVKAALDPDGLMNPGKVIS